MTEPFVWTPARSAMSDKFTGLLDRLVTQHGVTELAMEGFDAFMQATGDGVVLLTEEPDKVAESWDLTVILPDLLAAIGTALRAGVLRPEAARLLQPRFGIKRMPALLFLRDGEYVGVIEGLRDWSELVAECRAMLQQPVSRAPSIGIAVMTVNASDCH